MLSVSWAIHNTLRGWTLYDLSSAEVHLLVSLMSVNEIRLAKICQKNAPGWDVLTDQSYPEFFKPRAATITMSYPELPTLDKNSENGADTEYFVINPKRTLLPRLHTRYDICVTCTIQSSKQNFSTETIDISEGGLHFKDLLPDWIAGYFIVNVSASGEIYQLMCSLVEDQKEKKRVQVVSEESDQQYMLYKNWLLTLK